MFFLQYLLQPRKGIFCKAEAAIDEGCYREVKYTVLTPISRTNFHGPRDVRATEVPKMFEPLKFDYMSCVLRVYSYYPAVSKENLSSIQILLLPDKALFQPKNTDIVYFSAKPYAVGTH